MLADWFAAQGINCVLLAEPSSGDIGREIRKLLSAKDPSFTPKRQVELFLADRADDAEKDILPALAEGKVVIMDRYSMSNAAYQGAAGVFIDDIVAENNRLGFPKPHRTYLLDVNPDEALLRISKRSDGESELFEKRDMLARVRDNFIALAAKDARCLVIDGSGHEEEIRKEIVSDAESLIGKFVKTAD